MTDPTTLDPLRYPYSGDSAADALDRAASLAHAMRDAPAPRAEFLAGVKACYDGDRAGRDLAIDRMKDWSTWQLQAAVKRPHDAGQQLGRAANYSAAAVTLAQIYRLKRAEAS